MSSTSLRINTHFNNNTRIVINNNVAREAFTTRTTIVNVAKVAADNAKKAIRANLAQYGTLTKLS